MRNFPTCHSHPHSLDTGSTPEAFAKREVELGTGTLVCTDHGTLETCRQIYDLGKKYKLTPVLGLEGYMRDDNCPILLANGYQKNANGAFVDAPKYMHFCVHFLDQDALECGIRLLSAADARLAETLAKLEEKDRRHGQERKPLFTWADMEELGSHNVTLTSGCMIGVVQRHLMENDDWKTAEAYFQRLKSIVKPGSFFVEVNPHDTSKNWVQGTFLHFDDGTEIHFNYDDKKLMTNIGEITADKLAKSWATGKSEHTALRSVKNKYVWEDLPAEKHIVRVESIQGYLPNDPCEWAPDGNLQAGLNRAVRILARKYDVPIMIGDDSHYAHPEESVVQDVRLAQAGPWRFFGKYHRQSSEEAFEEFHKTLGIEQAEFEQWVENAYAWSDRFKGFKFETPVSLPTKLYEEKYALQPWFKGEDHNNSLRYTMDLIKQHGRMDWSNGPYVSRLQQEIELLHENGVIDLLPYFMIDEEICGVYEKKGLLTGPGRGSAAGLLLTYLLGITHVDPLKYELSVDRFLTMDRIKSGKLPDIDQDLPHRDLLVDPVDQTKGFLPERFGDCYAQISVDSTLKLKMAVKDVSRARRGMVTPLIEKLSHKFSMPPQGITDYDFVMGYHSDGEGDIQGSIETDPALKEYIAAYPEDWEVVKKCLGLARQKGRHACAFVIANKPIQSFIPLTTVSDVRVTAYTAPSVEAVGGLKMDFLVINSLNDISDAIRLIQERHQGGLSFASTRLNGKQVPGHRLVPLNGQLLDIWDLPEDQDVFADVATGHTETVFQFNTPGAVQWLAYFGHKKANGNYAIDSVEGMAAFTALDRPGPLDIKVPNPDRQGDQHNMLVEYSRRAAGMTPSPGVLKVFDEYLPETFGVMVYQEQLQRMYQQLTGCSGADAEEFRSNVAKKKKEKIDKAYGPFIENASKKMRREDAEAAWQFFLTWAKYGFNKSHAVCYATIGYACAFLKHHYPLEWWTAVLRNAAKNEVSEKFWRYAGHMIDLPDVKLSGPNFEIQGERIRAPLSLLKGVGDSARKQLDKYAPYVDIADFCAKINKHQVDNGTWEDIMVTKKEKYRDEAGKLQRREVQVPDKRLKKGYNALNRGVVNTLILSGAMDSMFPEGMHVGEQLYAFEDALVAACKCQRKKIDDSLWQIGPIARYQTKKGILPAYGEDVTGLVALVDKSPIHFNDYAGRYQMPWIPPNSSTGRCLDIDIINANELEQAEIAALGENEAVTIAVCGYVEDCELRQFGEERKEMFKLRLDVGGGRFEYVQWPRKDEKKVDAKYHQPLKGAVVIAVLNKWNNSKPFSLQDIVVVQPPMSDSKEEKADVQSTTTTTAS